MNESKVVGMVDAAISADQLIKKLEKELAILKDELKVEGAPPEGANSVRLEGTVGHATVALVKGGPKVRKGADLSKLQEQLGESFSQLFTAQVVYTPVGDFEDRFAALEASQREAVGEAVDLFTTTSKINFYPKKK